MEKLIFLASNSRDLYLEDIIRSVAYPNGFCLKLRYKSEWMFANKPQKGEEALFVFKHLKQESIEFIPIRKAKLISYEFEEKASLHTFFIELSEFVDFDFSREIQNEEFVFRDEVKNLKNTEWITKVQTIDSKVEERFIYTNILKFREDQVNVNSEFDYSRKKSFFNLKSEHTYSMDLIVYDSTAKQTFIISEDNDSIQFVDKLDTNIKTNLEKETITFRTNKLDVSETITSINFSYKYGEGKDFVLSLPIKLSKSLKKTFMFSVGIFMMAAGSGLLLGKVNFNDFPTLPFIGALVFSTAFGFLYHNTDKK